jgi:hypothetical protein
MAILKWIARVMKAIALIGAVLLLLSVLTCEPLSRPTPAKADYIALYFQYFDDTQIEKLDYAYHGAIGGVFTAGRAQCKGPVKVRQSLLDARISAGTATIGSYDASKMKEAEKLEFEHQWAIVWEAATRGKTPAWFDFHFDRKMRTIRESGEGGEHIPRFENTWYIDDERNVVYICGDRG